MKPKLQIRSANEADIPLILELIKELAVYEKLAADAKATPEQMKSALFGPTRYAEVLIGSINGIPEGFALFFHNFSTFLGQPGLYLEDLFVRDTARGQGLGKALLKQLAAIALERGCGRMEWSVLNWNTPAIKVYESIGAKPQSEWSVYRLTGDSLTNFANSSQPTI